jgi:hypothetical protein
MRNKPLSKSSKEVVQSSVSDATLLHLHLCLIAIDAVQDDEKELFEAMKKILRNHAKGM